MENDMIYSGANVIKLSDKSLEDLVEPMSVEVLIDKIAQINGWKTKRPSLEEGQTKKDYFQKHIGTNLTLGIFREFKILREHSQIAKLKWKLFTWDKSIARFFPDKIEIKIETIIFNVSSHVNLDLLLVDQESQTLFLLLEMWSKEIVADTFLSRVETLIPKYFRAYMSVKEKMLLVEDKTEQATKDFINIIQNAFNISATELRANAMVIREFIKTSQDKITRIQVKLPQEVAGFGGLSELTLIGSDVIKGSQGLMNRHETSALDVGPWVGASNQSIDINVGEPIRVNGIPNALFLFNIMKEL